MSLACESGHVTPKWRCPDCYALQVRIGELWAARKARDERMTKAHERGRHKERRRIDCWICKQARNAEACEVANALADIFNPRPAAYVPRGFRK